MKKSLSAVLAIVLALHICAFASVVLSAQSTLDQEAQLLQECAAILAENQKIDADDDAELVVADAILAEKNYESNRKYNIIWNYVNQNEGTLREHFAGAYIDSNKDLVVMLSGDVERCKEIITDDLKCSGVVFQDGNGSYYETKQLLNEISEDLVAMDPELAKTESEKQEILYVKNTFSIIALDDYTNTIKVHISMSPEEKVAVEADRAAELQNIGISTQSAATKKFSNNIQIFEEYFGKHDAITYVPTANTNFSSYANWNPGRALYNMQSSTWWTLSTGYRASYNYNSNTYNGFTTCAHNMLVGQAIYLQQEKTAANKIGVIMARKISGKVDVSFLRISNTSYTPSNVVYHTGSSTALDGSICEVVAGTTIYKSGASSLLTSGTVTNSSVTVTFNNGSYSLSDMFLASITAQGGDSGGVAYVPYSGNSLGTSAGILAGGNSNYTVFSKASNIQSTFGPVAY